MSRTLIAIAIALAALGSGCAKKKQKSGGETERREPQSADRDVEQRREAWAKADPQHKRRLPAALDPSEAAPLIPQVAGATVISGPQEGRGGKQVSATLCLPAADAPAAGEALRAALEGAGWQSLAARPHRTDPNQLGMSGQKPPYRITISVESGDLPGCAAAEGKVRAEVRLHKLLEPDQAKAAAAQSPAQSE